MTRERRFPKIELHVHLEGTVPPATILAIARRNDVPLPVATPTEFEEFFCFRDFSHFIDVWVIVTSVLRRADDFRQIVTAYAAEAVAHGAVYIEAIFSPGRTRALGVSWDEIFSGYCDGVQQAEEDHDVIVRLTPDIYRGEPMDEACEVAQWAVRYKDRGIVGLGLGGLEAEFPPDIYIRPFAIARDGGLGSVPHAGEVADASSIRSALDTLGADRIRHGIRAVEDPDLLAELAERRIVLDVCPTSNLRTGAVKNLDEHPLPRLVAADVLCSINTDDPAMFGTDLTHEYELAATLGVTAEQAYEAAVTAVLCDSATKMRLEAAATYE